MKNDLRDLLLYIPFTLIFIVFKQGDSPIVFEEFKPSALGSQFLKLNLNNLLTSYGLPSQPGRWSRTISPIPGPPRINPPIHGRVHLFAYAKLKSLFYTRRSTANI